MIDLRLAGSQLAEPDDPHAFVLCRIAGISERAGSGIRAIRSSRLSYEREVVQQAAAILNVADTGEH